MNEQAIVTLLWDKSSLFLSKEQWPRENTCIKFIEGSEVLHGRFLSASKKRREVSLEELLLKH